METRISLWAYLWDINAVGPQVALQEMKETGINTVSVALSYHAGHFLEPRNPLHKVYFPEDGTIYFQPEQDYGRIKPEVASFVSEQNLPGSVTAKALDAGLQVASWTVCLHNTRIGMLYPDVTTQNAFGDKNIYNLCPSHPAVQQYIGALIRDISSLPGVSSIELEALNYMGFEHEFHHEKDAVGLTALDNFLFSVCFCPSCMQGAQKQGIDAEAARQYVRETLSKNLEREIPLQSESQDFLAQGQAYFAKHRAFHSYLSWRSEPVTALLQRVKAAVAPGVKLFFLDLMGPHSDWMFGVDFASLGENCDGIVVCCYGLEASEVDAAISEVRRHLSETEIVAGFRLYYPEITGPAALKERVLAARQAGANGMALYNYGLVPRARLRWAQDACALW
ncbi:hypothetical protein EPA93_01780 [Ktedonosporobacter rubrisoli]|uniref:DUF4015 domain-containing protein n=1 Tax=Ktedonosporobacter rubrisoli TaxID=2509675 RepID=A0A4P6JIA6_KTERU|nr:hypothetical protein [Ktedonosporobacter rubrisoli]QBD74789.1 hypothetical protein EPA93_01780 [Ktedonosporobacter rubrisoli]